MQEGKKRVMLIVAYDGTNYCGWQVQPNGITIEQVLNENLSKLLGEEITVTGASRTDSGVHSMGNVAIFDTETRMPADKISFALNQRLPADIVVQDSCEVPSDCTKALEIMLSHKIRCRLLHFVHIQFVMIKISVQSAVRHTESTV